MKKPTEKSPYCGSFPTMSEAEGLVLFVEKEFGVLLTIIIPPAGQGMYQVMRPRPTIPNLDLIVKAYKQGLWVGRMMGSGG